MYTILICVYETTLSVTFTEKNFHILSIKHGLWAPVRAATNQFFKKKKIKKISEIHYPKYMFLELKRIISMRHT